MNAWPTRLALGAILVGAVAIRCYGLTTRSIWFDESFSFTLIHDFDWGEMIDRTGRDVHPPLFYVLLRIWVAIFGDAIAALRLFPVTMAALSIVGAYFLTKEALRGDPRFGDQSLVRGAALLAATFLAASPVHILWSQEIRMYTLATALVLWSSWFLLRAIRTDSGYWWFGYVVLAAASLYTHNYALFSVLGQGIFAFTLRAATFWRTGQYFVLTRAVVGPLTAVWLYLPWLPVLLQQKQRVGEEYWIDGISGWTVPDAFQQLVFPVNYWRVNEHTTSVVVTLILVAVVASLAFQLWTGRGLILALTVTPVAAAIGISLVSVSIIQPRHFLLAYVASLCGLACVLAKVRRRAIRWTLVMGILLNGLAHTHSFYAQGWRLQARPGIRGAAEYVSHQRRPGELVVVAHPCLFFSLRQYLPDDIAPRLYVPTGHVSHYMGKPILQSHDLHNSRDLMTVDAEAIWLVDTTGYTLGWQSLALPSCWKRVPNCEQEFPDVYYFQGLVRVSRYVRSSRELTNVSLAQ